jgi:hypothetical protein
MKDLFLCPHYGFGDYVIIYGLIKELSARYNIILFVIQHRSRFQTDNIKRLYSSIKNVRINEDAPSLYEDVFYLGYDRWEEAIRTDRYAQFQKFFYAQAGVPLNLMWDNFYFKRDMDKEKEIYYDKLGLKDGEEYILLHDDPVRGFIIDKQYIPDMRIIHLVEHEDISILDILSVVDKSKAVHTFTTGLVPFIDQMNIKHDSLNLHQYIRPLSYDQPILRLNWNIIN